MIKHIVMFRIMGTASFEERKAAAMELSAIFSSLESLACVAEFRTGINFLGSDAAWDFVIDSLFESRENLIEYQKSIEHTAAVRAASHISKEKAVVDYEIKEK
ncbi:MAG: Dabb family protein [Bacteroidales bacterium]|nr:Dabb family protein [Bacteroidales bacterium]